MKNRTVVILGLATLFFTGSNSLVAAQTIRRQSVQPAPQRQFQPAPPRQQSSPPRQQSPAPSRQSQAQPAPSRQAQAQTAPQRQIQSPSQHPSQAEPQRQSREDQAREQKQAKQQLQRQQQEQARQQKQQQKELQKQQQEEARQQKQAETQHQKQQQAEARQQKELQKQQQKLQKEQARQEQRRPAASTTPQSSSVSSGSANSHAVSPKPNAAYTRPGSGSADAKTSTGTSVINHNESQAVVQRVNSARTSMSGINKKPLPAGDVTVHPNGSLTLSSSGGRQYGVRANGTVASYSAKGQTASFDNKGRISSLHTSNMDIHHAAHGERTIVTKRADNSVLVSSGNHSGYLQRTVVQNNQTYIQRTVVRNNVVVTHTFVTYNYGGVVLTHYVAPVYFAPVFYGWAYYPWTAPIGFAWGWAGAPWYAGPNPYFVAYPTYPSASLWLTDYFLGETLALAAQRHAEALRDAAYEAESSADMSASDEAGAERTQVAHAEETTPITPELKAAIANEVREQLAYDNEAAQSGNTTPTADRGDLPSVLQTPNYVFVVSNDLDVMTLDQQQCGLQEGDILQLSNIPAAGSPVVQLRVVSSKRMDCPAGVQVTVSLQDLQDMHNTFRSQIEAGLGTLHDKMGHDGLPAAPQAAVAAPPRPSIASLTPTSGDDVTALLKDQQEQANQAEAGTTGSAFEAQN